MYHIGVFVNTNYTLPSYVHCDEALDVGILVTAFFSEASLAGSSRGDLIYDQNTQKFRRRNKKK